MRRARTMESVKPGRALRTGPGPGHEDASAARGQEGFTLIELMIVTVIIGILAAIAVPNFIAMQNRAKEGSVKANMHTFQLSAEDYGIQNDALYASAASSVVAVLPAGGANFRNPFDQSVGNNNAWEDRASMLMPATARSGITSYADSVQRTYDIRGFGRTTELTLILSSGQ